MIDNEKLCGGEPAPARVLAEAKARRMEAEDKIRLWTVRLEQAKQREEWALLRLADRREVAGRG